MSQLGPQAAAGCCAERADGEVPHRQVRLSGDGLEPRDHPLGAVPQRRAVQQRRRHQHARARHRLPGCHGLDRRAARHLAWRLQAQRAARAVRPSSSELDRQRRFRHRAVGRDRRRGGLWRAVSGHGSGQRRLRLQAEHHAGRRQLHAAAWRAQLQDSASTGSTSTTSAPRRRSSSTRSRRRRRTSTRRTASIPSATRR